MIKHAQIVKRNFYKKFKLFYTIKQDNKFICRFELLIIKTTQREYGALSLSN